MKTLHIYQLLRLIFLFILNVPSNVTYGQNIKTINGRIYEKYDGVWYLNWESDTFRVDTTGMTIQFYDASNSQTITQFEQSNNLIKLRENNLGFIDYEIVDVLDFFNFIENVVLPFGSIKNLDINVFGRILGTPNDALYSTQWHLSQAYMNVEQAWDITTGCSNIIVAVLDEEVDIAHEDLGFGTDNYNNFFYNSYEDAWNDPEDPTTGNNIDDDNNGKIDDWSGWDFYQNHNDVRPPNINNDHGTKVTSIIGAKTNNSIGYAGIAGGWNGVGAKNLIIQIGQGGGVNNAIVDDAILYAIEMRADIIQTSFMIPQSAAVDAALQDAYENHNIFIVGSAGNSATSPVVYPASSPFVFSVAASDGNDQKAYFSNYGSNLDLSAPGDNVAVLDNGNLYSFDSGTSFSSPMVSGTVALMLCNPCLSNVQIADILKHTADKVGGYNYNWDPSRPGHSLELGYGRLNTGKAVQTALELYSPTSLDLYIKDQDNDLGKESNPNSGPMWISPSIYIRNQQDGLTNQVHQNPVYDANLGNPQYNWVYVKVQNKSCVTSDGSDELKLYWAKAATALSWDAYWNGSLFCGTGPTLGDYVGSLDIPILQPGEETILEFQWQIMNPALYNNCNTQPWHFCFLARIDTPNDPMFSQETQDLYNNVKKNNNIAWKNVTVVTINSPPTSDCENERQVGGVVAVGNPYSNGNDIYDLIFKLPDDYQGNILEEAEVRVTLDSITWLKWANGGFETENLEIRRDDCRQIVITGDPARLKKLSYGQMERSTINVSFNFLIDEITDEDEFDYHVIQVRNANDSIIGGELYQIRKYERHEFNADAGGNQLQSLGDSTTLSASSIGEPAIYNWYNEAGILVYSGQYFTISPVLTSKYKLEVIALADGFVDYDSLTVQVKEFEIKSITPNPATNQITVEYDTENASSAFITITQAFQNGGNNYILDVTENSTVINLTGYSPGVYSMILFCNNEIADVKQLVIQ